MEDSTIDANVAGRGGGAIDQWGGSSFFLNATISGNWNETTPWGAVRLIGGEMQVKSCTLFRNRPYDLFVDTGLSASLENTLIEGSCVVHGSMTSDGGNLESPGDSCGLYREEDQVNVADPRLSGLGDNGGSTPTHLPRPGSPAIDRGVGFDPPSGDQRHVQRPQDGDGVPPAICDVGSVEVRYGEDSGALFADGFEMGGPWAWGP